MIGFAPEIGLLHGQRVHYPRPLGRGVAVVLQQVVVIEQRVEAALDGQRRERRAAGPPVVVVMNAGLRRDQLAQQRQGAFRDAQATHVGNDARAVDADVITGT